MRFKIIDDIQNIVEQGKSWATLELEYAKLTLAEKLTMLMTTLIIGLICLLLGMVVLILISFCFVALFANIMSNALAFICVAGIILLLLVLLWVFRDPLLLNPLAKMITRILIDNSEKKSHE